MATQSETKKQLKAMRDDLEQLRDTIRVKLHLGAMDVRDRFEELEPEVKAFERRAEKVTGEVSGELREGWAHLKKALEHIRDELDLER